MKRNILQTLVLSILIATSVVGALGVTKANASTLNNFPTSADGNRVGILGEETKINYSTVIKHNENGGFTMKFPKSAEEEKLLIEQGYEVYKSPYKTIVKITLGDNGLVPDGGVNWITPANLTDISQIKADYDKKTELLISKFGHHGDYYIEDGVIQTGWKETRKGEWTYYKANGKRLGSEPKDFVLGGDTVYLGEHEHDYDTNAPIHVFLLDSNDATKLTNAAIKLKESEFNNLLKQGKIGVTTELYGLEGELTESLLFYMKP